MGLLEMNRKTVAVSEFKARCTEYLASVEAGQGEIEITRHGKVIALAVAPDFNSPARPLLGAGKGTAVINESYDPHTSAWDEDDWEMNAE